MLDLTLNITADGTQAKGELRSVEQGIQGVDSAAKKAAGQVDAVGDAAKKAAPKFSELHGATNNSAAAMAEYVKSAGRAAPAAADVAKALGSQRTEVSRIEAAYKQYEGVAANTLQTFGKLTGTSKEVSAGLSAMRTMSEASATGLLDMVGAGGLSVGMLSGLAAGIGIVVAAGAGLLSFLVQSTQHYIEHGKGAAALRTEIDRLSKTWDDLQMMVGAAVMSGEEAPLVSFLRLAQGWAMQLGVSFARDILLAKELANAVTGLPLIRGIVSNLDPGEIPDPAKVLGGAHPLGSTFGWVASGAGAMDFPAGSVAERLFAQDEAERKRRAAEAARAAEARRRVYESGLAAMNSVGLRLGISGQIGTQYALPGGFGGAIPDLDYRLGISGSPFQEAISVESMLAGVLRGPGLGSRIAGSMGSNVGRILEGFLVNQGGLGSSLGGGIGSSIFGSLMQGGSGKAIGGALSGLFGSKIGGAIGNFLPFGGQILGSLLGGLFGKAFGPTQYETRERDANKSIADLWASLNKQYGGGADSALSIFGLDPAGLHGKNFQGAMGLDPLKGVFDELQKRQGEFNTKLGDTLGRIRELGGGIPAALAPYLEQLTNAKVLTQDNLDLIARMTGDGTVGYEQMRRAAAELGIEEDRLGQSFQNAKAQANWQEIIDNLDTLKRGGADINVLLGSEGLQKRIQELVTQSQKFGTEIPENAKPWIQLLIESGKLLGLNGEKIEDINQLKFGDTMQTSLEKLNDTLKELIETLSVKLPAAAKKGAEGWREEWDDLPIPGRGPSGKNPDPATDGGSPSSSRAAMVIDLRGSVVADDASRDRLVTQISDAIVGQYGERTRFTALR